MKRQLFLLVALLFTVTQASSQEWKTDFNEAKQLASKKDQHIILVFKGSDWCAPCIKLDREVFGSDTFKEYATDHFVLLEADFPKKKKNALPDALQKKNNLLAERYNKQGVFPFVVILDKDGEVLGETGYLNKTAAEYITHLESFKG
jgi:thioredoxin-related protein